MINFILIPNQLEKTAGLITFVARTMVTEFISFEQVLSEISFRSSVTKSDVVSVLRNLRELIIENLSRGRSVELDFLHFSIHIKGVFNSEMDSFDPERHWIEISIRLKPDIANEILNKSTFKKVRKANKTPIIDSISNKTKPNSLGIAKKDMLILNGEFLQFDELDTNQGIFFKSGTSEIRVSEYAIVGGNKCIFQVPDTLTTGQKYILYLKTLVSGNLLKGEYSKEFDCL